MSHSWQPPGHPYQVPQRAASEISNHNSPRSHQGVYYPQIQPPIYNPPPQSVSTGSSLYQTHSAQSADAYTFVDQVGNPTTVPVVSRHQVLRELANKQSEASITGVQLQEGADASRFRSSSASRARSSTQLSSTTSSTPAAHETVLQHWLVPDKQQRYWAIWTSVFTLAACFIFAFMAGNFAVYQQSPTYKDYNKQSQMPLQVQWGPKSLEGWLVFWQTTPNNSFDVGYMISWGARYQPLIRTGEWWRLFSSICLHGSFAHLLSNMLVFAVLAVPLEHSYGFFRIFIIFLASGFGGTFMSMAFEDPCYVYVGASGAVFGFIGLYLTDIILNFESMHRPLLRLALMLVSLGLTLGLEFATAARNPLQRVSHMSHIGGLIAGLFVSFMFLPNLADRRWKAARKLAARFSSTLHTRLSFGGSAPAAPLPVDGQVQSCWRRNAWVYWLVWVLSALVILFLFLALPVYLYVVRMPNLQCAPLT